MRSAELTLILRKDLQEIVQKVYTAFPEPSAVLRDGAPLADDAGSILEMAVEVLGAAADDPLIPQFIVTRDCARIAERAGCPVVSKSEALVSNVGRLAIGKLFLTTNTSFHPGHYDELAYDYTTERQRRTINPRLSGIIASEPRLQFAYRKATIPRMHALTMNIELDFLAGDREYKTGLFLPAHIAAMAIGQSAIRRHVANSIEAVQRYPKTAANGSPEHVAWGQSVADLAWTIETIDTLTPVLHDLGKPSIRYDEATAALAAVRQLQQARQGVRVPMARPVNRRARQNARALQPRRP